MRKRLSDSPPEPKWVKAVSWIGRGSILTMLAIIPWNYGSAEWHSQLLIVLAILAVFTLALVISLRQRKFFAGPGKPMLWFLVLASAQILSLPSAIWQVLAPRAKFDQQVNELAGDYERLSEESAEPLETASSFKGVAKSNLIQSAVLKTPPQTLSIYREQTRASLGVFAAGIAFFFAVSRFFNSYRMAVLLMIALGLVPFLHALLGIFQSVSWNDWTLLSMPREHYFSTFVSRNSAPQYYAIGIGAVLCLLTWWLGKNSSNSDQKRYNVRYPASNFLARMRRRLEDLMLDIDPWSILAIFAATLLLAAIFACASRGGAIACLGAILLTMTLSLARNRFALSYGVFTIVCIFCAIIILLTLDLDDQLVERMGTVIRDAESKSNPRYAVWKAALSNSGYWLTGCGLGTFHFGIIPAYERQDNWYYHAENVYVECFTEFGFLGPIVLVATIISMFPLLRSAHRKLNGPRIAAVFSLTAIGLQSIVDFSLIIPAIFISLAALLGCLRGLHESASLASSARNRRKDREGFSLTTALVGCFLILLMIQGIPSIARFSEGDRLRKIADNQQTLLDVPALDSPCGEIHLQAARLRQFNAEQQARQLTTWPDEVRPLRQQLSSTDQIAGALRATKAGRLSELTPIFGNATNVVQELEQSCIDSHRAISACSFDWRASWGVFQADTGCLSGPARARNFARLELLTNHSPILQQRVGTIAIWTGEKEIGLRFWRQSIINNPNLAPNLIALLHSDLNVTDVKQMLHDQPFVLASIAMREVRGDPNLSRELVGGLKVDQLIAQADTSDEWRLTEWVARVRGDRSGRIVALRKLISLFQLDTEVRYEMALLLAEDGNVEEARFLAEQAVRRSDDNTKYAEFLESLQSE